MAMRKYYGEGHAQYWLQWRWWLGAVADGMAGFMIWPAMPFVSVQILAPLIIVSQLSSSYVLGLLVFQEKSSVHHNVGLALAVSGVVGISMSTPHHAAPFDTDQFWAALVAPHFLLAILLAFCVLLGSFTFAHRSTFWALAASVLEGMQYCCSRTIVDSLVVYEFHFLKEPAVLAAICIKLCCIAGILHTQQMGLESDLSRFAGIFLVGCTLFMCVFGTAFFGEQVRSSWAFLASALFTLGGIWLLNQGAVWQDSDNEARMSTKEAETKDDDVDSVYEGAEPEQSA